MMVDNCSSKQRGEGIPFLRIHRITGYLVGDISRWNSGKKAELQDRVTHDNGGESLWDIKRLYKI